MKNILVVEDSSAAGTLLRMKFTAADFRVT